MNEARVYNILEGEVVVGFVTKAPTIVGMSMYTLSMFRWYVFNEMGNTDLWFMGDTHKPQLMLDNSSFMGLRLIESDVNQTNKG